MIIKKEDSYSFNDLIEGGGLSRVWQHTKDTKTFAIIGSQDQKTKEDRSDELISKVSKLSSKNRGKIGYKYLFGRYQYDDGSISEELSIIIFNISKQDALTIGEELNQDSIIWKDKDYFGFLTPDGKEDGKFSNNTKNFNFSDEDIKLFGSRLAKHKHKNQLKWFKYVLEQFVPQEMSSIRNMALNRNRKKEALFEIVVN